jgi:hypothetical protein
MLRKRSVGNKKSTFPCAGITLVRFLRVLSQPRTLSLAKGGPSSGSGRLAPRESDASRPLDPETPQR